MNLADGLHLHARIAAVRTEWLAIERAAERIDDNAFSLEVFSARQGILSSKDRLEQLLTDPEPEADLEIDGVIA